MRIFRAYSKYCQTNSKWFFQVAVSSKKRTNKVDFTTMIPQVDLFSFIFWKILKTPKRYFEINWPLNIILFWYFAWEKSWQYAPVIYSISRLIEKRSVFFVGNNFTLIVFIYKIHTLCSAVFNWYHQGSLSMDIKAKFSAMKAPVQVIKRTNPWPWLKKGWRAIQIMLSKNLFIERAKTSI